MFYFINNHAAENGNHEVHAVGCKRMPTDKAYLGNFENVGQALVEARKDFWQSSCCEACGGTQRTEHRPVRISMSVPWALER
jgi:hypothetical protein